MGVLWEGGWVTIFLFLSVRFFFANCSHFFVPNGFETLFEYETKSFSVQYFWRLFYFGHFMAEQFIENCTPGGVTAFTQISSEYYVNNVVNI